MVPTVIDYKSQIIGDDPCGDCWHPKHCLSFGGMIFTCFTITAGAETNYKQKQLWFNNFSFTLNIETGEPQVIQDHTQKGLKTIKLDWDHPVHLQHMSSTTLKHVTQYISYEQQGQHSKFWYRKYPWMQISTTNCVSSKEIQWPIHSPLWTHVHATHAHMATPFLIAFVEPIPKLFFYQIWTTSRITPV